MLSLLSKPYRPHSIIPRWLFLCFCIAAVFNLSRLLITDWGADTALDFRPLYLGQKIFLQQQNPYNDSLLKSVWADIAVKEGFRSEKQPGFPLTPLVYPPWAVILYTPFNLVNWKTACTIWYGLVVLFFAGALYFIYKINVSSGLSRTFDQGSFATKFLNISSARRLIDSGVLWFELLIIALALKSTVQSLIIGQPLFLCLFTGFGAIFFSLKKKHILAGLALSVCCIKISLAIPFILLLLFDKQWKIMAIAVGCITLLLLIALIYIPEPTAFLLSYFDNLKQLRENIFQQGPDYPLNHFMIMLTETGVLAEYLLSGSNRYIVLMNIVIFIPSLLILWQRQKKQPQNIIYLLSVFAIITFCTTYHLYYDVIILLILYPLSAGMSKRFRFTIFMICIPLFLPINGLLNRFSLPDFTNILYFSLPVVMLSLLVLLLAFPVLSKHLS